VKLSNTREKEKRVAEEYNGMRKKVLFDKGVGWGGNGGGRGGKKKRNGQWSLMIIERLLANKATANKPWGEEKKSPRI